MKRGLDQLNALAEEYDVPVICAGDIFDRWNSPAELIYFALENLPDGMYSIPGQHDLPNHNYGEMRRSAYGVLSRCGKIADIPAHNPVPIGGDIQMHAFPWGEDVMPPPATGPGLLHLAVVHAYIWSAEHKYHEAPEHAHAPQWRDRLAGYNAALFGDNHKGFSSGKVHNNGTFFRRKSDERQYRPQVGLLMPDATICPHYLDVSQDKWADIETATAAETIVHSAEFIAGLRALGQDSLDFREYVRRWMVAESCNGRVRELVFAALEGT